MAEDAHKIVKFIRLCHIPLALFCKHTIILAQRLSLVNPGVTRFATNFFMVAKVLDMKETLKQIVIDGEWNTYVRTLLDTQKKPMWTQAQGVRRLILSDDFEFRQSCANYCTVMKAVVAALKEFDSKQPCMGNIYIIMRALHHYVVGLHNAPFNMPSYLVDLLAVAFKKR